MKIARASAATTLLLLVFAMVATMSAGVRGQVGPASENGGGLSPAQARKQVDDIAKDVREARAAAARIGDKALRERIERLLGQAELRARDLSDQLARARGPRAPAAPVPLSSAEFDKLLKGLRKEPFDEGRLKYVENFASKAPLYCEQGAALLKCFAFDEGRVKAAKLLYPVLVDPRNFNDMLDTFVFDRFKAEVRKAVGLK
jgi:hypothetical protein